MESMTMRKMVLVIAISSAVSAVVMCLIYGLFLRPMMLNYTQTQARFGTEVAMQHQVTVIPTPVAKMDPQLAKVEPLKVPFRAKAVNQDDAKEVEITVVRQKHRFEEGDKVRHVSGDERFDVKIWKVREYLDDGVVVISYVLDSDFRALHLKTFPAAFVDACYNKR